MDQVQKSTVMKNLIGFFRQGALCPAEFWRAVESCIAPSELNEVFSQLDGEEQGILRQLFHERPLSLRTMESRAFRGQLRKWVVSGHFQPQLDESFNFMFLAGS